MIPHSVSCVSFVLGYEKIQGHTHSVTHQEMADAPPHTHTFVVVHWVLCNVEARIWLLTAGWLLTREKDWEEEEKRKEKNSERPNEGCEEAVATVFFFFLFISAAKPVAADRGLPPSSPGTLCNANLRSLLHAARREDRPSTLSDYLLDRL